MELVKRYKIVFALALSLVFTIVITKVIFFEGIPKINAEKVRRTIKNTQDSLTIFKNTFAYKLSSKKIDYEKTLDSIPAVEFEMSVALPTVNPTITNTPSLIPSPLPTITVPTLIPTSIKFEPTPTKIILAETTVPTVTKKPKRTRTPTPEPQSQLTTVVENSSSLRILNPLDQPYYKPGLAYQCYNPDKFIEVYANGLSPDGCYSKIQSYINSNLTSVSILGKSISVHKKAYPAFKAVADALSKDSVAKKYKINTIGAYVFRCNVNASTSDRNDLCSSGCVLSTHSFGIAVDINWDENCNGCANYTMPMEIVDIFESYGFRWGGRYKAVFGSRIDPMHFEYMYDLCKDLK